jgi:hypothetical protein
MSNMLPSVHDSDHHHFAQVGLIDGSITSTENGSAFDAFAFDAFAFDASGTRKVFFFCQ